MFIFQNSISKVLDQNIHSKRPKYHKYYLSKYALNIRCFVINQFIVAIPGSLLKDYVGKIIVFFMFSLS